MSQVQRKQKIEPIRKAKKAPGKLTPRLRKRVEPPQDPSLELWKNEVENLRARSFASLGEAWGVVVERVLDRMQLQGRARRDTAEFLELLFETDPALQDELQGLVKIKR